MYCLCVNVYCHRLTTQLQLINISYILSYLIIRLPCSFLSFKANVRVKLVKTGHGPHSSTLVVICVVLLLFVLFYVLFVCKCVLPPVDNPIAVNKYIIHLIIRLAVFPFSMKVFCMNREEVRTFPYVVQTICFKLSFSRARCSEHHIQTDKLKESKQTYVNWQHHSSDAGRKTLLLAPYFTGAFCTAG